MLTDLCRPAVSANYFHCILYLTVWGVGPLVTHQTSWLESTGVCGVLTIRAIYLQT